MKKSLFFGMAAMLMVGITSCSDDDLISGDRTKPLEADQSFFVNIDILSTESMTRSGLDQDYGTDQDGNTLYKPGEEPNYQSGTGDENKVQTIFFIFYDMNGDRVATTQVRRDNANQSGGRNESENSLYKGVVQIDVNHGFLKPAYVMCFINPITSQNFDSNPDFASLSALQKTTRPKIIDDNGLFAMSKSVYYGPDRTNEGYEESWINDPNTYKKIIATPIGEGQLFTDIESARKALEDDNSEANLNKNPSMVDIYVERYAAKVNFKVETGASEELEVIVGNDDTKGTVKLKFIPDYWAVNAYESNTYICKSFLGSDGNGGVTDTDLSYTAMNEALGAKDINSMNWFWNNPARHRSYWAQSPAYYADHYPRVADDIIDNRKDRDDSTDQGGYILGYYSYDQMAENAKETPGARDKNLTNKARKVTEGASTTIYARENTIAGSALKRAYEHALESPKAAVASAVLVGHYEVDEKEVDENTTFYIMGNSTNGYTYYREEDDMINYFVNTTVRFAKDSKGTPFYSYGISDYGFEEGTEAYQKLFKISHPSYDVRNLDPSNPAVVDSRFVTIQLDEDALNDEDAPTLYAYLNGSWEPVTTKGANPNFNYVNQQMYYQAGTVQGYQGGKAYFTIPIKHLGFYRDGNSNAGKMGTEKNFKWNEVMSGDFGLVRNHVYSIEVSQILGLGNGIPNPFEPIVPPTDPEEYFIGARVIVLNWAVVPTQSVIL